MDYYRNRYITNLLVVSFLFLISFEYVVAKDQFPGRMRYSSVPYISMDDLKKRLNEVVIVDVRSKYEYDTLKIKGAINIPISSISFIKKMETLRKKSKKLIVVYCNGKTCMKSYKATKKCQTYGIKNVIAYDQGVLDWAKRYPKDSVLLGKNPINPKHIISKRAFKKHLLSPVQFEAHIDQREAIVLDMRDAFQRDGVGLFRGLEKRVSLDNYTKLNKIIKKAKSKRLPLYIYDETGKQVRWLMYYLEKKKVKIYYFMEGGAQAYFSGIRRKYVK